MDTHHQTSIALEAPSTTSSKTSKPSAFQLDNNEMPTLKTDGTGTEDKQANLKPPPEVKATKTRQMNPKMRGHQDQTTRPRSI